MKKLVKPTMSVREIMQDISATVRDPAKQKKITDSIEQVEECAAEYDNLAVNHNLHSIQSTQNTEIPLDAEAMQKLYKEKFSAGKLKEKYYDKLIALAENGRCPICGIGQVSNLDHYLAKTLYPIYSITPTNLIPICWDCNFNKRDTPITSYVNSPFHPYYDDIDDMIWLEAKLIKKPEGNVVAEYFVSDVIKQTDRSLYDRMNEHCNLYELFELYSIQASTEIAESLALWRKIVRQSGGSKTLKNFFTECLMSRECFQKNTWYTALMRALINDVEIIL